MADTYDKTLGGNTAVAGHLPGLQVFGRIFDLSKAEFTALNSSTGPGQNDVLQLIDLPAKTVILGSWYEVVTASSNLDDLDLGDGSNVDDYHDGIDATSTGSGWSVYDASANGKYYSSADTADAKIITAASIVTGRVAWALVGLWFGEFAKQLPGKKQDT